METDTIFDILLSYISKADMQTATTIFLSVTFQFLRSLSLYPDMLINYTFIKFHIKSSTDLLQVRMRKLLFIIGMEG